VEGDATVLPPPADSAVGSGAAVISGPHNTPALEVSTVLVADEVVVVMEEERVVIDIGDDDVLPVTVLKEIVDSACRAGVEVRSSVAVEDRLLSLTAFVSLAGSVSGRVVTMIFLPNVRL